VEVRPAAPSVLVSRDTAVAVCGACARDLLDVVAPPEDSRTKCPACIQLFALESGLAYLDDLLPLPPHVRDAWEWIGMLQGGHLEFSHPDVCKTPETAERLPPTRKSSGNDH
jgi:hypothetical protein